MSAGEILLWIILPYVAIDDLRRRALVALPHRPVRLDERARPSCFERRILGWAGPAFHYGALAAVGGHVIGLMIPKSFTDAVGMSESTYRWFSAIAGARRRRGLRGRVRRARLPAGDERPGAPHDLADRPARLLPAHRPDRPGLLDDVRAQPGHRVALRLPRHASSQWWRSLFFLQPDVEAVAGRQHRLPGARDRRLGVLGAVPVQPARARLEHPAAVPRPPLHPLPPPLRDHLRRSR